MNATNRNAVAKAAKAAAAVHQEEFPGQACEGDWDSEAWEIDGPKLGERLAGSTEAWTDYRSALHLEVARLRWVRQAGGLAKAVEAEGQILSIGRSLLPAFALTVLDGGPAEPEYWRWLGTQLAES